MLSHAAADAMPDVEVVGYGFGLFQVDDIRYGRIIGHSGGYPGFGSNMRWHPASGLGVIVLANHRYGPAALLARDMLARAAPRRGRAAAPHPPERAPPRRRATPSSGSSRTGTTPSPPRLFAMNVELDEPLARASGGVERLRGAPRRAAPRRGRAGASRRRRSTWPGGCTASGGRVRVEILLSPELPPKVQTFALTSVPEPPPALRSVAERILAALDPPASGPRGDRLARRTCRVGRRRPRRGRARDARHGGEIRPGPLGRSSRATARQGDVPAASARAGGSTSCWTLDPDDRLPRRGRLRPGAADAARASTDGCLGPTRRRYIRVVGSGAPRW